MRSRVLIATLMVVAWTSVGAQQPPRLGGVSNPAVDAALEKGEAALTAGKFKDALSAFKRANSLEKQQSATAFYGISRAYRGLRDFKREGEAATSGITLAVVMGREDPMLAAQLYNQLGMALSSQATKPGDPAMKDAGQAFYDALTISDTIPIAWFNLGVVLMQQGRDEAGREALNEYIRTGSQTAEADLARKYIAEPRRARGACGRRVW